MSAIEFPAELAARLSDPGALIPAIAQDAVTGEVLMLAYMNHASLTQTLSTKAATYWSRSRNELWVKGSTSGHTQEVISVSLDCDSDAILLKVNQVGAACHTGDRTCFHTELTSE
jgi:phosphoribosyl-AMP cyclohydrolase